MLSSAIVAHKDTVERLSTNPPLRGDRPVCVLYNGIFLPEESHRRNVCFIVVPNLMQKACANSVGG